MRHYLKVARENKGYTQRYVAEQIGISQNYYCDIENGIRQKELKASTLNAISRLLEIPLEEMISEEEQLCR